MKIYPVFEFLPFETIIKDRQEEYYNALSQCDKVGKSTIFIEFILKVIDESLVELLQLQKTKMNGKDRLAYFISMYKSDVLREKIIYRLLKIFLLQQLVEI